MESVGAGEAAYFGKLMHPCILETEVNGQRQYLGLFGGQIILAEKAPLKMADISHTDTCTYKLATAALSALKGETNNE